MRLVLVLVLSVLSMSLPPAQFFLFLIHFRIGSGTSATISELLVYSSGWG